MKQLRVFNFNNEECVIAGAPTPVAAKTIAVVQLSTVAYNDNQRTYGQPCAVAGVVLYDLDTAHVSLPAAVRVVTAADDIEDSDIVVFFVNNTGDPYAGTLPLAADFPVGQRLYLGFAGGADGVDITPQEDETIDDELDPITIDTGSPMLVLESDGVSNWTTI